MDFQSAELPRSMPRSAESIFYAGSPRAATGIWLGWPAIRSAAPTPPVFCPKPEVLSVSGLITISRNPADPTVPDHCGNCTACIDVCPTRAITAPYQLDARRCIAYLTIEHQGPIPPEFRQAIGDHLFSCDDCLDVCPWNRWAQVTHESEFDACTYPDLRQMSAWTDEDFSHHFQNTLIHRLRRNRWLHNVSVVLGNIGSDEDLPALRKAALDPDPLIAEHADWAVSRITEKLQATNKPDPAA